MIDTVIKEVARLFGIQLKQKLGWRIDLKNYNTEVMVGYLMQDKGVQQPVKILGWWWLDTLE